MTPPEEVPEPHAVAHRAEVGIGGLAAGRRGELAGAVVVRPELAEGRAAGEDDAAVGFDGVEGAGWQNAPCI